MLSFIRSPLQPANDRARANIAKTRIGFSSPHEDNGNRYDHNSQWHPILDMEAEDVEPLDKHVQGPLPPRSEELVARQPVISLLSDESAATSLSGYSQAHGPRFSSSLVHTRRHEP